jgi:hypothetical protein
MTAITQLGCIRFRNDAPPGADAAIAPDAEIDVETPPEGGDAVVIPPPVCARFPPTVAASIAGDLVSMLLSDCLLRRHFAHLPPVAITHFEECLTAQIGQIMGCRRADGEPFKYPIEYAKGKFCRDMKSSHSMLSASDGDFDAFIADLGAALERNDLMPEEKMRVLGVFGATRNDIVRIKDAGPTAPCDAPDAT